MKEKKTKISVRNITLMAMLIAIEIVLSRFCSIQAWNVKIGFAFIAPVTAAILMGPAQAAVVAGVADVLGTLMFPIGPYFPGFTLNSCLNGLVWGLFLHKKPFYTKSSDGSRYKSVCNRFIYNNILDFNAVWFAVCFIVTCKTYTGLHSLYCAVYNNICIAGSII